ncbi:hypothetical protein Lal_00044674 [Lupinus albus]|nr:hypothetical protein Lal_00044674 [Lupinus albus]
MKPQNFELSFHDSTIFESKIVMVRVEKQRGHPFPKLVRSPERRKLSCLAMAEERDIIANREER